MAASIDATVGGASANSFGTVAEADTYHEGQLHASAPWADLTATQKIQTLIMAQQLMTALLEWTGDVVTSTQKLPWPRMAMRNRNDSAWISESVVPDEVKNCQFELARLLGTVDRTLENDVEANGLTYLRAASVTLKFKESFSAPGMIPAVAYNLLPEHWYTRIIGVKSNTIDLLRA